MEVTLSEVIDAARQRSAPLTAEVAGYLALLVTEQLNTSPLRVGPQEIVLNASGDLLLGSGHPAASYEIEADLRSLLAQLLGLCQSSTPALKKACARPATGDLPSLHAELFAALIPINHAASRRALARLCRETYRARAVAEEAHAGASAAAADSAAAFVEALVIEEDAGEAAPVFAPVPSAVLDVESAAAPELAGPLPEAFSLGALALDPVAELATTLPAPAEVAAVSVDGVDEAGFDIDVQFLADDAVQYDSAAEHEPFAVLTEADRQLEEGRRTEPGLAPLSWPASEGTAAALAGRALAEAPRDTTPSAERLAVATANGHRSDLSQLIANFLADSGSDERIIKELRRMIGLDLEAERASERARALGG
jgi:hypothetical protein